MFTDLLIKLFVCDDRRDSPTRRLAFGTLSGVTGIAVNFLLFMVKAVLALISGSVALGADAVNNLADCGNAAIALFGFRISAKPADEEHPFGHGRVEYVAALVVAVLVISAGLNFFKSSIQEIIEPVEIYTPPWLIVVTALTLLFKVWLAFFYRRIGEMIHSEVIKAQFTDCLCDLLTTLLVLVSMILPFFVDIPLDGYAGIVVALFTIVSGVSVLKTSTDPLLGTSPDSETVKKMQEILLRQPGILGVHDIIMHSYGPSVFFATAHAEIAKNGDLVSAHDILENAEVAVAKELPVHLLLHGDPFGAGDREIIYWRSRLEKTVAAFDPVFKVYDFRLEKDSVLSFHMLIPRTYALSGDEILFQLEQRMKQYSPEVRLQIKFVHAFV